LVLLNCLHNPTLDRLFSVKCLLLVTDSRVVRKRGENGFHVVRITGADIIVNDSRRFDRHNIFFSAPSDRWNRTAVDTKFGAVDLRSAIGHEEGNELASFVDDGD
jgi:hypothetical protein